MRVKYQSLLSLLLGVVMLFSLGGEAFAETLTLPAELQTIEEEAFYGDTSLDEVVIPEGATTIGQRAFADSGLKRIDIPDTVTAIADNAFDGTEDLTVHAMPRTYAAEYAKQHGIHWEHDPIACTELELNQQATGSITQNNEWVYYSFTPESSGVYNLQSESPKIKPLYLLVFDPEWNEIGYFFGSPASGTANLTAGETYYIGVTFANEPMTGDIQIKVNADAGLSAEQYAEGHQSCEFAPPDGMVYYVPLGAQFTAEIEADVERGGLRYEWYLDGVLAEGQTSSTYTLTVERFHRITGRVYDDFGNYLEYLYTVYADTHLYAERENHQSQIYVQPGGSATMTVKATCDLEPLTYQWYRAEPKSDNQFGLILYNYIRIDGATEPSYTVQDVHDKCVYWCEVTDPLDNSVGALFYLYIENHFTAQARNNQTTFLVKPGELVEMAVEADADTALSYQWYIEESGYNMDAGIYERKTILIDGATESSYTIQADRTQSLYCVVSDPYGNTEYIWFYLTIDTHLNAYAKDGYDLISMNPGESIDLEVIASCDAALSYQWYEQSEAYDISMGYWETSASNRIDGATESHYYVEAVNTRKIYVCLVSDPYGNSREVRFSLPIENHLEAHAENDENVFKVAPGTTVDMVVEASCDRGPLQYQWYVTEYSPDRSGYESRSTRCIRGATESSYSTDETYNKKYFFCHITDSYGNTADVGFDLQIESNFEAHAKDNQTSINLDYGQSEVLTVEASCDALLTYQWFKEVREYYNDSNWFSSKKLIGGATESSYRIDSQSPSTQYYCLVSDPYGNREEVQFYVRINTHLEAHERNGSSISATPGQPVLLAVEASCDVETLYYQWYESIRNYNTDGSVYTSWNRISGATESSYVAENINSQKDYYCRVTDHLGNSTDVWFYLRVDTHLQACAKDNRDTFTTAQGETLELTVEASCDTEISYQWFEKIRRYQSDGNWHITTNRIDGATNSSYTVSVGNEQKDYFCRVSDTFGGTVDVEFNLPFETHLHSHALNYQEQITVNPGESKELVVEASCDTEVIYQWYEYVHHTDSNGGLYYSVSKIAGATGSSYTTDAISTRRTFVCWVRDNYGNKQEVWFRLSVETHLAAYAKNNQDTIYVDPGESAEMTVQASCNAELVYQWYNRVSVYDNNGIYLETKTVCVDGATDSSYTAHNVNTNMEYYCRVSDPFGNTLDVTFYLNVNQSNEA